MQIRSIPALEKRFGFADLGGADANRAGRQLQPSDVGRFVGLGVGSGRDPIPPHDRLHHGDVLFHPVEIDTQRWCVEIPFRDANLGAMRPGQRGLNVADGVSVNGLGACA